ncbi:MAG: nucleoside 2-deoxyribosyltransferase [candidate division KSB1 bacterium]|nr:nucleoside 2-deoxyribosyltransferase [candidate division KSB1 bacterium]MDZ7274799.1 nucleoside 2-deoxyribosyltransferase [candidate division KSB1 bacterium]MDZ7285624.1 nucleoside 2-deoxyribosyltransferase [candidate division KSB1 bacterium]MDZ7298656.1 nucleoside 2-deoxyribosyltransferase [candidate division KSB1 bacterium]MDZ7307496.1 nucleoside 2-deoxyribosyltransferase [candidate division KSB1 bacterium]
MKLYFSAAISAGRQRQPLYQRMVAFLEELGGEILTKHVAHPRVLQQEAQHSAVEIFCRDRSLLAACDALVAEVSTPSLGVGYEIAVALQQRRPVLCLCKQGIFLTRMLTGNPDPNLTVRFYAQEADWQEEMRRFHRQLHDMLVSSHPLPRVESVEKSKDFFD